MRSNNSHGFTIIELLLVVAMVSIISAIAVPSLVKARDATDSAVAIAQLKGLQKGQATFYVREFRFARLPELNSFADNIFGKTVGSTIKHREFVFTMLPSPTDESLKMEYTIVANKIVNGRIMSQHTMSADGMIRTALP